MLRSASPIDCQLPKRNLTDRVLERPPARSSRGAFLDALRPARRCARARKSGLPGVFSVLPPAVVPPVFFLMAVASSQDKALAGEVCNSLRGSVEYAPFWVRLASALCLGLRTMFGYRWVVLTGSPLKPAVPM